MKTLSLPIFLCMMSSTIHTSDNSDYQKHYQEGSERIRDFKMHMDAVAAFATDHFSRLESQQQKSFILENGIEFKKREIPLGWWLMIDHQFDADPSLLHPGVLSIDTDHPLHNSGIFCSCDKTVPENAFAGTPCAALIAYVRQAEKKYRQGYYIQFSQDTEPSQPGEKTKVDRYEYDTNKYNSSIHFYKHSKFEIRHQQPAKFYRNWGSRIGRPHNGLDAY